jgi:hypothetical protein
MSLINDPRKRKFRYRKGQWRKRVVDHIEYMVNMGDVSGLTLLEACAKLARMGFKGEEHLGDARYYKFSDQVLFDIQMILLVIHTMGKVIAENVAPLDPAVYEPSDPSTLIVGQKYHQWSPTTRRHYKAYLKLLEDMTDG